MAPLLPKLRGHFAEFLNKGFSARLRILSSPTCVGLRYGRQYANSGFSWQYGVSSFSTCFRYASHLSRIESGFAYFQALVLARLTNWALRLSSCVPTSSLRLPVQEFPPVVHRLRLSASP